MEADDVVIVSAVRTPVGVFNGQFATTPAHVLGAFAIRAALARSGVEPGEVDEVILGQVLTAAQGQNPARQAAMAANVPKEATAWSVNQLCGSGLRAVALAMQQIRTGDARIMIAGGQENMSLAPHAAHLRSGKKMGSVDFKDTMLSDGLWDAFHDIHMGSTAEALARRWQIGRKEQDAFALRSQDRAIEAQQRGRFADEIEPVAISTKKGEIQIDKDEAPRAGTTLEALTRLRPTFEPGGTVTAGNSSGLNDGAAALVLMSAVEASRRGLQPLARIASWATAGVEPGLMGTGPIPATRKALKRAGWTIGSLDLIESNEAFAAQACTVMRELEWDPEVVNVNGGAIALGHPIGASGARILVTLLHEMKRRQSKRGLVTLCIGGGMGIAMTVERSA